MSISRQASTGQLAMSAERKQTKLQQKATRSKRCKSLLMLSSPFSSSTSSVKSSLLSLLHPNQSHQSQDLDLCAVRRLGPMSSSEDEVGQSLDSSHSSQLSAPGKHQRAKCVKMKLFEQPLDKLFSPKAMKQLNNAINANSPDILMSKRKRSTSSACLQKFSLDANNNTNNNSSSTLNASQRKQLLLSVLPEPIRNLLNELYLRGPSTVGIFRKSPNAKHCKELRHKLETDSRSSIEQFQVTVIASVFKEWLRSLPDCLLMSCLYPQWIDVAKLIEPLYQQQQQQQRHQSKSLDDSYSDNTISGNTSLRPSGSPLTDNGQLVDRAHSCFTMMSEFSINKSLQVNAVDLDSPTATTMTAFALLERRSECLRIVRQLLDALDKLNLVLLHSFISVLWHIASNSEHNKMSANNLGICVGQSLLNDEHQFGSKSAASTFSKRHQRSRSHCLLSSTLSLTNSTLLQNGCYLDTNGAQETAKYVPLLVAFMIENAPALFGQDIIDVFSSSQDDAGRTKIESTASIIVPLDLGVPKKGNQPPNSSDHVDGDDRATSGTSLDVEATRKIVSPVRQQIVVVDSRFRLKDENTESQCNITNNNQVHDDSAATATTSILIVNPPKRQPHEKETQHRPLSATESTSSSRASSSTSGIHSESLAFSSEVDSQNTRTTTPSPSSVSSPSSVTSISPVQEPQEDRLCSDDSGGFHHSPRQLSETPTRPPIITLKPRYQNRHMINRYSTFMGVLNRVPKIPVQFTTSNYGGEAVIYNPKPRQRPTSINNKFYAYSTGTNDRSVDNLSNNSVISVKPLTAMQARQNQMPPQQSHTNTPIKTQQELRELRLNEFLAHQHHPLVSLPLMPYPTPPQDQSANSIARHNSAVSHQQANFVTQMSNMNYAQHHPPPPHQQQQQRQQQQQQQHQHQYHPIFYSATNLNSLQQNQQQDYYMLYHQASLEPQRSHVMSLRDYYLSLQQNQQHQQQHSHRNPLHQQSQLLSKQQEQRTTIIKKLNQSSQQQEHQRQEHSIVKQQYLVANQQFRLMQATAQTNIGLATHQTIQRPQTRLARIRQNQFNGIYVKNDSPVPRAGAVLSNSPDPNVAINLKLSSLDPSSDESDEYVNDWVESTMV